MWACLPMHKSPQQHKAHKAVKHTSELTSACSLETGRVVHYRTSGDGDGDGDVHRRVGLCITAHPHPLSPPLLAFLTPTLTMP